MSLESLLAIVLDTSVQGNPKGSKQGPGILPQGAQETTDA